MRTTTLLSTEAAIPLLSRASRGRIPLLVLTLCFVLAVTYLYENRNLPRSHLRLLTNLALELIPGEPWIYACNTPIINTY
jgi:hypothetical protein